MHSRLQNDARPQGALMFAATTGSALALAVVVLLAQLHGAFAATDLARDAILAVPLGIVAVWLSSGAGAAGAARALGLLPAGPDGLTGRIAWALAAGSLYAAASIPATAARDTLFLSGGAVSPLLDASATLAVAVAVLAAVAAVFGTPWQAARPIAPRPRPLVLAVAGQCVLLLAVLTASASSESVSSATAASANCTAATAARSYDVAAISLDIPVNRWGHVVQNGAMYVLQGDKAAYRNWSRPLAATPAQDPAGNRRLRPRPLVLRANEGECVEVVFTNELNGAGAEGLPDNPRASMHVAGPAYNVQTGDGAAVGFNRDTTVPNVDNPATAQVENRITYYWRVPAEEGLYMFRDIGVPAGSEHDGGGMGFGLFGGLAVEPAGSRWTDPASGRPLYTGTRDQSGELYIDANIELASGKAFRESVQLSWDEVPGGGFGFNYGIEPGEEREQYRCGDCVSEETSLSSWTYGDPALVKLASGPGPWLPSMRQEGETDAAYTARVDDCGLADTVTASGRSFPTSCWSANVVHTYRGDATKIRFAHAGSKETHVFHLHAHQWLNDPEDVGSARPAGSNVTKPSDANPAESQTIDSQTYGPGDAFTADLLFGSGSKNGTFGDSIFHCHLYPHFAEGFWALLRTHDVEEDGTGSTPDGIRVRNLESLPGEAAEPQPTALNPGFPRFIPGKFGWRAPQAPGAISEGGALDRGGTAAPRIVAGRQVPDITDVERAVQKLEYGDTPAKPGAPMSDPCPAGARQVTYHVSVLQKDVVYNKQGWHDTQGRILVLDKDVDDVLAGRKKPEPLFFRVNAGDCINYRLTNLLPNWMGGDAFLKLTQTNMVGAHIHLVKFDVLASDGSSNGWNYQQAAYTKTQADFDHRVLDGTQACTAEACRVPDPATFDAPDGAVFPGQTIHERWYADYELKTVFTHDHHFAAIAQNRGLYGALVVEPKGFDVRNPETGTYLQPINSSAHGTPCGSACEGEAAGARVDVVGPGAADDSREFGIAVADFVSLTKPGGDPRLRSDTLNPPAAPEVFPADDPGVMAINYRTEAFQLRDKLNGVAVDPAYRLSSWVWGDPSTPLLEAYAGDNVEIRAIQGSQEEQHVLAINGVRWRGQPDDPQSPWTNARPIGISEAFNFKMPAKVDCGPADIDPCFADHLYAGTSTDDMATGMWGIMRVYGRKNTELRPLPDFTPAQTSTAPMPSPTGDEPPLATKPGTSCPATAPVKRFDVVALQRKLVYDKAGDNDPYGLMYAVVEPGETADDAVARVKADPTPEPMVLRANEGDCIEVQLTNKLTAAWLNHTGVADGDAPVPLETGQGLTRGLRVSLHPQLVQYDVKGSDGATVGFNKDQTVGPNQSILYRWFADDVAPGELGTSNLLDFGDIRGHRHHGLFAGLNIEPKGSTYHDPITGEEIRSGAQADIRVPAGEDFREFTTFLQDGLNLRTAGGAIIDSPPDHAPTPEEPVVPPMDAEDQGEKGFNYATEMFARRLNYAPNTFGNATADEWAHVFDSRRHGDPATPIFRAYAGDKVVYRVLQGGDKPRQHAFQVSGHSFKPEPNDPGSQRTATLGGWSVGRTADLELGQVGDPGDYRYHCNVAFHHMSGGLWGIMRVYDRPANSAGFAPDAIRPTDDPFAADYHPLMPLERSSVTANVFRDADGSGTREADEGPLAGVQVRLRADDAAKTLLQTGSTAADGSVTFGVMPGVYHLEVVTPADFGATTGGLVRVDASGSNTSATGDIGLSQLGDMTVRVYRDLDTDGTYDAGEESLAGWAVTVVGGGSSRTATTGADGLVKLADLPAGDYSVSALAEPGFLETIDLPVAVTLPENGSLAPPNEVKLGFAKAAAGVAAALYHDANTNGVRDAGERPLANWKVTASGGPAASPVTVTAETDADGVAEFDDPSATIVGLRPGTYTITPTAPADWSCGAATAATTNADGSGGAAAAVSCAGGSVSTALVGGTGQVVTFAERNTVSGRIEAVPFNDLNADNVRQETAPLVGWTATLFKADGVTPVTPAGAASNAATTGADGVAAFDRVPVGGYVVKFAPPAATPVWSAFGNAAQATATVTGGGVAVAQRGFVQKTSVQANIWHDLDKDGVWDAGEPTAGAGRTVKLLSSASAVLKTATTDASGHVAFATTAGTSYFLQVVLPAGWQATAPKSGTTVQTKVSVKGALAGQSAEVRFGQFETADTTKPAAPAASPAGGISTAWPSVTLTAETGARIRYTTTGATPSATAGRLLSGPVAITQATTLKAVAIDAAGNVGPVMTETYHPMVPSAITVTPTTWTALKGSVAAGSVADLAEDDGVTMALKPTTASPFVVEGYGSYGLPAGQRDLAALAVEYDGGASVAAGNRTLALRNFRTGAWETVKTEVQTAADVYTQIVVGGDVNRFVSTAGEIWFKVRTSKTTTYQLTVDRMSFTVAPR